MKILRGDIWWVRFGPAEAGEPDDLRPAVIVSRDEFNRSAALTVTVIPGTTTDRGLRHHVRLPAQPPALPRDTTLQPELVTVVAKSRLIRRCGPVDPDLLAALDHIMMTYLDLL